MVKLFNKLLVPVKFNANTSLAMEQAVQLANRFSCDVHVLHVKPPMMLLPRLYDNLLAPGMSEDSLKEAAGELVLLKKEFAPRLDDGLVMSTDIQLGNWHTVMKDTIIRERIDLVIIPWHNQRLRGALLHHLNINRLSQQTHCPILTVTRKFDISKVQKIVVPVNDCLPVNKLTIATYLARDADGCIFLVGNNRLPGWRKRNGKRYLLRSYQLLREYSRVRIHCAFESPDEACMSTLRYAKNVSADLILLHTGAESIERGWLNRLLGKYLYRKSGIPVLTIAL